MRVERSSSRARGWPRPRDAAVAALLLASVGGCASSRTLLSEHRLAGDSERFDRSREEVFEAARSAVAAAGMRIDDVVDRADGTRILLASRGMTALDYGAIARVIVEPVDSPSVGAWARVVSALKLGTNFMGRSDYRVEILERTHGELARGAPERAGRLPPSVLAARAGDPLVVGTLLRIEGRRAIVTATAPSAVEVDDPLWQAPKRIRYAELASAGGSVERLIRRPFSGSRLLVASTIGIGLGWLLASDGGGLPATGVYVAAVGIVGGAVWGSRDRTGWTALDTSRPGLSSGR